jgi:hypothetical protein
MTAMRWSPEPPGSVPANVARVLLANAIIIIAT